MADQPLYTPEANAEHQLRVIDFVPLRYTGQCLLFLILVAIGSAMVGLHHQGHIASRGESYFAVESLDLNSRESLAGWFNATVLSLSAILSLVVYAMRRHKTDDYGGRYRIWRWATACLLLLSVNSIAGLHHVWQSMMVDATAWRGAAGGALWWILPCTSILVFVGGTVLVDLRESRLAFVTNAAAYSLWIGAVVAKGSQLVDSPATSTWTSVIGPLCFLAGNVLLLMSVSLFARFVMLDVQGKIQRRPIRDKRGETDSEIEDESDGSMTAKERRIALLKRSRENVRTDVEPVVKKTVKKVAKPAPVSTAPATRKDQSKAEDNAMAEEILRLQGKENISKAERRRLRKLMRRRAA